MSKKSTEQKIFYFLYIKERTNIKDAEIIKRFEKLLKEYDSLDNYQKNRQLLKSSFKTEVDKEFSIV
jgi:hypothetical protein